MKFIRPSEHLYKLDGIKSEEDYQRILRVLTKESTKREKIDNGKQFLMPRDNIAVEITHVPDANKVYLNYVSLSLMRRIVLPEYIDKIMTTYDARIIESPSTKIKHFHSLDALINS